MYTPASPPEQYRDYDRPGPGPIRSTGASMFACLAFASGGRCAVVRRSSGLRQEDLVRPVFGQSAGGHRLVLQLDPLNARSVFALQRDSRHRAQQTQADVPGVLKPFFSEIV
jgi:hypothetical protein